MAILEHICIRPEVNSNQFEISNCFEKLLCLHDDGNVQMIAFN